MQAVEVVKELAGIGTSLSGTLLLYDAAAASVDRIRLRRRAACAGTSCALALAVSGKPAAIDRKIRARRGA